MPENTKDIPLSGHLEELRKLIGKCLIVWFVTALVCFVGKDLLFRFVFAPAQSDFVVFKMLQYLSQLLHLPSLALGEFTPHFIATELTAQFLTHITVSMVVAIVVCVPFILYQLFLFIAPALQQTSRKTSAVIITVSSSLFFIGVMLNYFIIFPFAYRFLSTYQVHQDVINQITISSYISLLVMLSLLMGVLFELPIVAYLLAKWGLVTGEQMRHYRKHAFVAILILSAIITPTADAITLSMVTLPIYALYLLSVAVANGISCKRQRVES
ncbi:MAG: twin-arginine translocase subunit TatC [Paludibacteraceae bacterium]|nr:twin-arginine translocase subunit TatC [Paludibacteraceae bacterium]